MRAARPPFSNRLHPIGSPHHVQPAGPTCAAAGPPPPPASPTAPPAPAGGQGTKQRHSAGQQGQLSSPQGQLGSLQGHDTPTSTPNIAFAEHATHNVQANIRVASTIDTALRHYPRHMRPTCLGCGSRQWPAQALCAARPSAAACRHTGRRQLARVQSCRQLSAKGSRRAVRQLHHRLLELVQVEQHLRRGRYGHRRVKLHRSQQVVQLPVLQAGCNPGI